jgi:hypothetical protein
VTELALPMLLDFITVFCFVGGCFLLWLNLRPRQRDVIITRTEELDLSEPSDVRSFCLNGRPVNFAKSGGVDGEAVAYRGSSLPTR